MNQLQLKIRRHASLLKEFSLSDMIKVCGEGKEKDEQIHQELTTLVQGGYLIFENGLYRLNNDLMDRTKSHRNVDYFLNPSAAVAPVNDLYYSARDFADRAETNPDKATRKRMLELASDDLKNGFKAENRDDALDPLGPVYKAYQALKERIQALRESLESSEKGTSDE